MEITEKTEYFYDVDGIKIKEITDGIESIYIVDSNVEHSQILEK